MQSRGFLSLSESKAAASWCLSIQSALSLCCVTININTQYENISINEENAAQTILILGKTLQPEV